MAMNPNPTSAGSEFSRARAGRSDKLTLRALGQNLMVRARLWLDKLLSLPYARVVMIFAIGFAAGAVWQSYSGAARKAIASWSPHLTWLAPTASSERIRTISLSLATARQNLDRAVNEVNRLEGQGANEPRQVHSLNRERRFRVGLRSPISRPLLLFSSLA